MSSCGSEREIVDRVTGNAPMAGAGIRMCHWHSWDERHSFSHWPYGAWTQSDLWCGRGGSRLCMLGEGAGVVLTHWAPACHPAGSIARYGGEEHPIGLDHCRESLQVRSPGGEVATRTGQPRQTLLRCSQLVISNADAFSGSLPAALTAVERGTSGYQTRSHADPRSSFTWSAGRRAPPTLRKADRRAAMVASVVRRGPPPTLPT